MTMDDIIRMAREAGFQFPEGHDCDETIHRIARLAYLAQVAEREACLVMVKDILAGYRADIIWQDGFDHNLQHPIQAITTAIRARGEKSQDIKSGIETVAAQGGLLPHQREKHMTEKALDVQVGGGHYKRMAIQPVEYIHKNGIPYIEGCVIKYISRWRNKNGIEDLKKAKHFIDLLIELESK
jgi:hypothetical protein